MSYKCQFGNIILNITGTGNFFCRKSLFEPSNSNNMFKLSFGAFTTILNLGVNPPVVLKCPCFPRVQCGEVVGCVVICIVVACVWLLLVATALIVTAGHGTPGVMG